MNEQKKPPSGEMAQYKCRDTGMVVGVAMLLEEGRWYAQMWNDKAMLNLGDLEHYSEPIPASPWCLELSSFGEHYEPVAPLPKLGDKNG